jgi:hypothetical protein
LWEGVSLAEEEKMKRIIVLGLVILLNPVVWPVLVAMPQDEAVFLRDTENGLIIVQEKGLSNTDDSRMFCDASVIWSAYLTDAIFRTTAYTLDNYVFAGTYLNPPKEAELFALTGGGIPDWIFAGTEFYTDAGDGIFTLAAVDKDALGINVSKWSDPGNSTPDWTTSFLTYAVNSYGPIAAADDGSTIAVIAAPSGTDAHLLLFDTDSMLVDYVASGLGFPRYVKINADGRYTAFIALSTIIVFDRDLLSVRAQISMGFTNSAMDISGDGNLLAYGWPTLRVMEWNGASYQELWNWSPGGHYVGRIAISTDGSTIVSCWYTSSHNTIKVVVHNVGSSTPLWIYDYPMSSGVYQESASDMDITDDGKYFVICSWGDAGNINPEVNIFQRDTIPHIFYSVDMPGSSGRGGDIVMIGTDIVGISENDLVDLHSNLVLLSAYPNPFTKSIIINFSKAQNAESIELKIYDISGKMVKSFGRSTTHNAMQPTQISWDGKDDQNRQLPTGVYFVKLQTDEYVETDELILIR